MKKLIPYKVKTFIHVAQPYNDYPFLKLLIKTISSINCKYPRVLTILHKSDRSCKLVHNFLIFSFQPTILGTQVPHYVLYGSVSKLHQVIRINFYGFNSKLLKKPLDKYMITIVRYTTTCGANVDPYEGRRLLVNFN